MAASAAAAAGHEPGESDAYTPLHRPERGLISGRTVWNHFIIPASNALPNRNNQGTIVVFNLDSRRFKFQTQRHFPSLCPVKELRETPLKKHQKFVEFYDARDAAKALREMNGKEINGKQVIIEFSRPRGFSRKFLNSNTHNISLTPSKYNHSPSLPPPKISHRFSKRYFAYIPPRSFLSRSQSPTKKVTDSSKGNPNDNNSTRSSIRATVVDGTSAAKKTAKKSQNNMLTQCSRRPWKDKRINSNLVS